MRDNDDPADLHYDRRERGKICERDIFEARERACYIKDIFDGVLKECEKEGAEEAGHDGKKPLTAYFTLPLDQRNDIEIPMATTYVLEPCIHSVWLALELI